LCLCGNNKEVCSLLFRGYPDCIHLIPDCTQLKVQVANRFAIRFTYMHQSYTTSIPGLFCKPQLQRQALFYSKPAVLPSPVVFYSLDLENHLPVIHKWVNLPYTQRFWQMAGSFEELLRTYTDILFNPNAHSLAGYYDDKLICQVDVYRIAADELGNHLPGEGSHCGFHLLMGPNKKPIHGLSSAVVHAFLSYYFSFRDAQRIYGEPDVRNANAIAILERARFLFLQHVKLSYKTAALYCMDREDFFQH
jgi:RimJ/RimL family protein N-acetyltransferase